MIERQHIPEESVEPKCRLELCHLLSVCKGLLFSLAYSFDKTDRSSAVLNTAGLERNAGYQKYMALQPEYTVRLLFDNEAQRRSFMMDAITKVEFLYTLENFDAVLVEAEVAGELATLASKFGGTSHALPTTSERTPRHRPAITHDERVKAWSELVSDLEHDLAHATPFNKLTLG